MALEKHSGFTLLGDLDMGGNNLTSSSEIINIPNEVTLIVGDGGLIVDTNVLHVNGLTNRVGINTSLGEEALSVSGNSTVSGTGFYGGQLEAATLFLTDGGTATVGTLNCSEILNTGTSVFEGDVNLTTASLTFTDIDLGTMEIQKLSITDNAGFINISDGPLWIAANGDTDNYFTFTTTANLNYIGVNDDTDLLKLDADELSVNGDIILDTTVQMRKSADNYVIEHDTAGDFYLRGTGATAGNLILNDTGGDISIGHTSPSGKVDIVETTVSDIVLRLGRGTTVNTSDITFITPSGSPQNMIIKAAGTSSASIFTTAPTNGQVGDWQFNQNVAVIDDLNVAMGGNYGGGRLNVAGSMALRDSTTPYTPENLFEALVNNSSTTPIAQFRQINTGDSAIRLRVPAGSWTYGIDNSDDDNFKINWATSLGTAPFNLSTGGDLFFEGEDTGLLFGEIYANDNSTATTISSSGQANKVQITIFDTNGQSNGLTPDHTNDHITISRAGKYLCTVSLSVESGAGGAFKAGFSVYKNNGATEFTNCHTHRNFSGGGGDVGSLSISGIIDCAANDTIELWGWNETNTTNFTVEDVTLSLTQIGGT